MIYKQNGNQVETRQTQKPLFSSGISIDSHNTDAIQKTQQNNL